MKDRHISHHDFLRALEREYICLVVRQKIYRYPSDYRYFQALMDKKVATISALSATYGFVSIFQDSNLYRNTYREIVPIIGYPKFIYNPSDQQGSKSKFPYAGTVVKILSGSFAGKLGMSHRVDFEKKTLQVELYGSLISIPLSTVERQSHEISDEYYYYYPGTIFTSKSNQTGVLDSYDFESKMVTLVFDGMMSTDISRNDLTRII